MITKDEILDLCRDDIRSEAKMDVSLAWLEIRKIEVLCDIRDILYSQLDSDQAAVLLRLKNP